MFNRALQVKVVNTKKSEPEMPTSDTYFEKKAEVISREFDSAVKKVGMFAIGYVVIDTLRQVLVAKASK